MKKMFFIACTALVVLSCNNSADSKDSKSSDTSKMGDTKMADSKMSAAKVEMPYTLDQPYQNWQTGNPQHAANAMKALKAFETGDIASCVTYFGDSVELRFDNYFSKVSNDSLKKLFTNWRAGSASITIKMGDWESVISEDKKDEWVTMWYKEIMTDKKGKTDSLGTVNDCKMVNGKIVILDEKIQHLPAKK